MITLDQFYKYIHFCLSFPAESMCAFVCLPWGPCAWAPCCAGSRQPPQSGERCPDIGCALFAPGGNAEPSNPSSSPSDRAASGCTGTPGDRTGRVEFSTLIIWHWKLNSSLSLPEKKKLKRKERKHVYLIIQNNRWVWLYFIFTLLVFLLKGNVDVTVFTK